jgi:hypothetical protein
MKYAQIHVHRKKEIFIEFINSFSGCSEALGDEVVYMPWTFSFLLLRSLVRSFVGDDNIFLILINKWSCFSRD